MDISKRYDIHFKGLGAGEHRFRFDVDDAFFTLFEGTEVRAGKLVANVVMTKSGGMLSLDFSIRGNAVVECDRCLEDCQMPVDYQGVLTVKFSDKVSAAEDGGYDGEIMWLNTGEDTLNVAQYIYESIVLSLPYQRVHADKADGTPGCDPDMLERFSIVTEEEFEQLTGEPEMQKMADNPEWDKLRKLREKM